MAATWVRILFASLIIPALATGAANGESQIHTFTPRSDDITAPERGLYTFKSTDKYGYPHYVNLITDRNFDWVRRDGFSLVSSRLSLERFRTTPLSETFLNDLSDGFAALRRAKLKVILRFNYNNGNSRGSDAPMARIREHISQLAPILTTNADLIFALQAGFIGAWGEWHSSTNGLDTIDDRRTLVDTLLNAIPERNFLQIRYPQHKLEILKDRDVTRTPANQRYQSRIGFHIDCILASENDLTYPLDGIDFYNRYIAIESRSVLVGGETCRLNPPRTDCDTAMEVMQRQHFTYLNADFDPSVITHWKKTGCYKQIKARLGYFLRARSALFAKKINAGTPLIITLDVENSGWASPVSQRFIVVDVVSQVDTSTARFITPVLLAAFQPGRVTTDIPIDMPQSLPPGRYDIFISAPDSSPRLAQHAEYSIPFQNTEYDEKTGRLHVGAIQLVPSQ
jgi:hypothetical protein